MTKQIHLLYAPVNMAKFNQWAGQRDLVRRGNFDEGFALHILLTEIFGQGALKPFRLFSGPRRRMASLYAYASFDHREALSIANDTGLPDSMQALNPAKINSKVMRTDFAQGQRLGFDVRTRPVRRLHKECKDSQSGKTIAKGSEVDAFRATHLGTNPDGWRDVNRHERTESRSESYFRWFVERIAEAAEICPESFKVASFKRTIAVRGHGSSSEGPDATLQGDLLVKNPDRFSKCIAKGIGRHKAYGFGMLLLRPVATNPRHG